jgi:hypothetical protein
MRAEIGKKSVALFNLSWECVHWVSLRKTAKRINIDLGTKSFLLLHELANTLFANNGAPLYFSFQILNLIQTGQYDVNK